MDTPSRNPSYCAWCDAEFYVTPHNARTHKGGYCCKECRLCGEDREARRAAWQDANPEWTPGHCASCVRARLSVYNQGNLCNACWRKASAEDRALWQELFPGEVG